MLQFNLVQFAMFSSIMVPAHIILALFGRFIPQSTYYQPDLPSLIKESEDHHGQATIALESIRSFMKENNIRGPLFNSPNANELCIHIVSGNKVERNGLRSTVASLLTRTPWELQDKIRITLTTEESPEEAYKEASDLGDLIRLFVVAVSSGHDNEAPELSNARKEAIDYAMSLKDALGSACRYSMILEDDTIASQHWHDQLKDYLNVLEDSTTPWLGIQLAQTPKTLGYSWKNPMDIAAVIILTIIVSAMVYFIGLVLLKALGKVTRDGESLPLLENEEDAGHPLLNRFKVPSIWTFLYLILMVSLFIILLGKYSMIGAKKGLIEIPMQKGHTAANLYPRPVIKNVVQYLDDVVSLKIKGMKQLELKWDSWSKEQELKYSHFVANPSLFQQDFSQLKNNRDQGADFKDKETPIKFDPLLIN